LAANASVQARNLGVAAEVTPIAAITTMVATVVAITTAMARSPTPAIGRRWPATSASLRDLGRAALCFWGLLARVGRGLCLCSLSAADGGEADRERCEPWAKILHHEWVLLAGRTSCAHARSVVHGFWWVAPSARIECSWQRALRNIFGFLRCVTRWLGAARRGLGRPSRVQVSCCSQLAARNRAACRASSLVHCARDLQFGVLVARSPETRSDSRSVT